jgi:hypothetical protein
MPNPIRTEAEIEAELDSIDAAARANALKGDGGDPAPTKASKTPEHDYEYEARRKGWKPEGEYTGPEGKWVDAQTFVERGERFTKKLEQQIETLNRQVAAFEGTKKQFSKFFDEQMAKRDREHAEAISALRVQRSQAIREGDDDLAVELEDRIDATRKQQQTLKDEAAAAAEVKTEELDGNTKLPTDDPVLKEWIDEGNAWFRDDEVLAKHAIEVGRVLRKDGEKAIGRAFLEKVKEQVQSDFPRRFKALEGSGQRNSPTEGSGQGGTGATNKSGYNGKTERDLPPEDLAMMRQFIRDGLYTKEAFLKSYFSRNGG